MGFISSLFLLAASFHFCLCDETCPPSSTIAPCGCDGEGINCMKVKTDSEIQRIFTSIPKPWSFRGVWIQGTDMTIIPAGMFKGIQVQGFNIEVNKIRTVQKGAFAGSENSCYTLSVFGNEISDFPFSDLKTISYLQIFNAGRNKLTSIPDRAFYGIQHLSQIILPENLISYIGHDAFNGLPLLIRLDLLHNRITMLGPSSLAMNSQLDILTVNLANCSIANIAPSAFNGMTPMHLNLALNNLQHLEQSVFLPLCQRMANNGGVIETTGNRFTCIGCSFRWLANNKNVLMSVIPNFRCLDGRNLQSLNDRNIMCQGP